MGEFTIELKGLHFFSFHGLYDEEKKTGSEFTVDLFVKFPEEKKIIRLQYTINYEKLFDIVKDEMNQPRELLETLAQSIINKIHVAFPSLKEIEIRIEKKKPPIADFTGTVAARLRRSFK